MSVFFCASHFNNIKAQNKLKAHTVLKCNSKFEKNDEPARFNICIYGILGAFLPELVDKRGSVPAAPARCRAHRRWARQD
jgi:hypothetical protein